jgi:antirestriction protein ArdC
MHSSELFDKVSRQVITAMETSGVDWCKSWAPIGGGPVSISTGEPYSGFNVLILGLSRMANGWNSNHYGTFKILSLGVCSGCILYLMQTK